MPVVVISEFMHEAAVDRLRAEVEVRYDPRLVDDRSRLFVTVWEADALIVRNRTRVDQDLLTMAPQLRVVGRLGSGVDNIDVDACRERGVTVHTAAGENARAVAEYVIGALLVLFRPALVSTPRMLAGEWPRTELVGREVAGKRLGLVGLGATASLVATTATALGMEVSGYDPYTSQPPAAIRQVADLDQLFRTSEAVSVHVPLTSDTARLVDSRRIGLLPEGAVLVDPSRGGVVDHGAVVAALAAGQLAGAALDVFEQEPLDAEAASRYRDVPGLVLTPHIAGLTVESDRRVGERIAADVLRSLTSQ